MKEYPVQFDAGGNCGQDGKEDNMGNGKQPLYLQVKNYLMDEIREKRLLPGSMISSEKELSEQFKVSRITVRKALSELEAENVIYRYPGKGTFVSDQKELLDMAEREKEEKTEKKEYAIGVIMSHLDSPFQVSLLQALEKALGKRGYQMMFGLSHGRNQIEDELIDRMRSHGVDGLVIYPVDGAFYSEKILKMSMEGFPVVLVDRYLPGINTCSVYSDDRKGGQMMGEYLLKKGHRRIALLSQGPKNTVCLMDRIDGFYDAMLYAGIPRREEDIMEDMVNCAVYSDPIQYEENIRKIERFLSDRPEITAVYCTIATFAINALQAARRLGRTLEIVCFDSVKPYQWTEKIAIPYIAHSETEMGQKAIELMTRLLNGEKGENIIIPCQLIEESSEAL